MKASFTEHLAELRRRLIAVIALFAFATLVSYPLAQPLLSRIKDDLFEGAQLVIIEPQEAVMAYISASMLVGFALVLPALTYHLWVFVAPALRGDERRLIGCLIIPSALLFLLGVAFGYFVLLPVTLRVMLEAAAPLASPMISLGSAMSLVTTMLFALGLVFQMPLISAALSRAGLLKPNTLAHYRRHMVVALFLLAGILTPDPTPVAQTILAVPMIVLYELSILSGRLAGGWGC